MAGKITAKSGNIADFEIGKLDNVPCLYYSAYSGGSLSVSSESLVLAPKGISWGRSIGGSPNSLTWKMIVGEKFGTTRDGTVYAVGGVFTDMTIKNKLIVESKLDFSKIGFAEVYDGEIARTNQEYEIQIPEPSVNNINVGNGNIHFDISWDESYRWTGDSQDYVLITYSFTDDYTVQEEYYLSSIGSYDGRAKISCVAEPGGSLGRASVSVRRLTGTTIATGFKVGGGFLPASSNTYILGSPSATWKEAYIGDLYADNIEADFAWVRSRIKAIETELAELKSKI